MDPEDLTAIPPLTLGGSTWAIRPDTLPRLVEAHRKATPAWAGLAARAAAGVRTATRRTDSTERASGAVAVLPLTGVLTPHGSLLSMLFGGSSGGLTDFRENFRDAVTSPDVGAIVLDIDSPGGLHSLVPETAAEIRDARGSKPIIAVANTMAASGAYWIGAQADEFVVTPSGDVGSVGVYMLHEDWSGWNEKEGIRPTYIHAAKYKVEGNMDEPLDDEAKAYMQAEVDSIYTEFLEAVAEGRGTTVDQVRASYGEGRTLRATDALTAGMVDRIDTVEAVIGGLLVPDSTGRAAAMAGRHASIVRPTPRAEAQPPVVPETAPAADPAPAPAAPTVVPAPDPPSPVPANDPTHDPGGVPQLEPDPVVPDVGPDAPTDPEARAAIAAILI